MFGAGEMWSFVVGADGCYDYAKQCENKGDSATALQWYEKAADKGSSKACFWLAKHHQSDVEKYFQYILKAALADSPQALKQLELQAAENNTHAQFILGDYYYAKNDQSAAVSWWAMAFERGHKEAAERLKTEPLEEKILEMLAELYETGDAAHKRNLGMALVLRTRQKMPLEPNKLMHFAALQEEATENREAATLAAWGLYKQLSDQGVHEARRPMERLAVTHLCDLPESAQPAQLHATVYASDLHNKKSDDVATKANKQVDRVKKPNTGL